MGKIIAAMVTTFFVLFWPLGGLWVVFFGKVIGGGGQDISYVFPIYAGIIFLVAVIVGAAMILYDEVNTLRSEVERLNKKLEVLDKE